MPQNNDLLPAMNAHIKRLKERIEGEEEAGKLMRLRNTLVLFNAALKTVEPEPEPEPETPRGPVLCGRWVMEEKLKDKI